MRNYSTLNPELSVREHTEFGCFPLSIKHGIHTFTAHVVLCALLYRSATVAEVVCDIMASKQFECHE